MLSERTHSKNGSQLMSWAASILSRTERKAGDVELDLILDVRVRCLNGEGEVATLFNDQRRAAFRRRVNELRRLSCQLHEPDQEVHGDPALDRSFVVQVFDDDLRILLLSLRDETFETFSLEDLNTSGKDPSMAMVELRKGEVNLADTALGDGPVHAACMAIERIVGVSGRLEEFQIRAASPGKDAMGEAHVIVNFDKRPFTGTGASTDIIEASVLAYLNALNKIASSVETRSRPKNVIREKI